ncbi:MAG: head GIN domain-containing protein [Candidatus Zixiibacteriota bacterium]
MTKTKRTFFLLSLIILLATSVSADNIWSILRGRDCIDGSGEIVTQTRDLGEFTRIESSGSFDIYVYVGSKQEVTITFDDNLIDLVETRVHGKTLDIFCEETFRTRRDCRIEIHIPELRAVKISGSGDVEVYDLKGDAFEYEVSGSGDMRAEGAVGEVEIKVSGSGDVDLRDLMAQDAYIKVSGSGDVKVYASESLTGRVSGSGDIQYYGDPQHVSRHVSGSGSIRKK